MRIVERVLALVLGLIGCAIGLIVNVSYSAFHRAAGMLGDSVLDRTHGFIGLGLIALGVVASILALFQPIAAAILLLIIGIALFFVVKGFALFTILFFVLAALFAFLGRHRRHHHVAETPNAAGS